METILKGATVILIIVLTGCAATGQDLRATAYDESQVNQPQEVTTVKIISIMPAKINIDNSRQQEQAKIGGGIFGAIVGATAGAILGESTGALLGGGLSGGVAGVATGSLVDDKILVDGVTLAYQVNDSLKSSTQVGLVCEYTHGKAFMIKTSANNTRIQPNATCPDK